MTDVDRSAHERHHDYTWAPDSRWIAYTKTGDTQLSEIWVYSLAGRQAAAADGEA